MKRKSTITHLIELDGLTYRLAGDGAMTVADASAVDGEKWLVTDLPEAMSHLMTVEGPGKYADMLVRRKLQESGEFDEPVHIITHWKKKHGKNATDIFFTAVPTRVAGFYLDVLRRKPDLTLVVPVYALLWETIRKTRAKEPVAVVLRHDRFAEVLVGDPQRVFFANRCVAFDTESEQLRALWETVRSDLADVESEHRITVSRVIALNWLDAGEQPDWPQDWLDRLVFSEPAEVTVEDVRHQVSWPGSLSLLSPGLSASPAVDRLLFVTRQRSVVPNLVMLAASILLVMGMVVFQQRTRQLDTGLSEVKDKIRQIRLAQPVQAKSADYAELIKFVGKIDQYKRQPSYRRILFDLTQAGFHGLTLQQLKIDFSAGKVMVEIFGDIHAPFEQAHGGYQRFLQQLRQRGYRIEESKFETQISKSQIVLKLSRQLA